MTKPVIVTRLGKGSELTFQEGDSNFTNLRDATVGLTVGQTTVTTDLNGAITLVAGSNISLTPNSQAGTITVAASSTLPNNSNGVLTNDGSGNLTWANAVGDIRFDFNGANGQIDTSYNGELTVKNDNQSGYGIRLTSNNTELLVQGSFVRVGAYDAGQATTRYSKFNTDGTVEFPAFKFPAADGTSNQVLKTDGQGILTWTSMPSVPSTTDSLSEGQSNLYFTTSRARDAFSASTGISISDGAISSTITQYTDSAARAAISVTQNLTYDSQTGVITGPNLSGYATLDGSGKVPSSQLPSYVDDVEEYADTNSFPQSGETGKIYVTTGTNKTYRWTGSTYVEISQSATYNLDDLSDVVISNPSTGQFLKYNGPQSRWENSTASFLTAIGEDANPLLGGNLNIGSDSIVSSSNGNITLAPNGTGQTKVNNINYYETPYALTYGATITPDVANGNVQIVTLTGNVTFSAFSNPISGQSLTLIVKQDATGSRTLTSTMKFAGGTKTLSTAANAVDIISVFYDGTNYWASLGTDFK